MLAYGLFNALATLFSVASFLLKRKHPTNGLMAKQRLIVASVYLLVTFLICSFGFPRFSAYFPVKHHCASEIPSLLEKADPNCLETSTRRREFYSLTGPIALELLKQRFTEGNAQGLSLRTDDGKIEALATPWKSSIHRSDAKDQWMHKLLRDFPDFWPGLAPLARYDAETLCDDFLRWREAVTDQKQSSSPQASEWKVEVFAASQLCPQVKSGLPMIDEAAPVSQGSLTLQVLQKRVSWMDPAQAGSPPTQTIKLSPVFLAWLDLEAQLHRYKVGQNASAIQGLCRQRQNLPLLTPAEAVLQPWRLRSVGAQPAAAGWDDLMAQDETSACLLADLPTGIPAQRLTLGQLLAPLTTRQAAPAPGFDPTLKLEPPQTALVQAAAVTYHRALFHLWTQQQLQQPSTREQSLALVIEVETKLEQAADVLLAAGIEPSTLIVYRNRLITHLAQVYADVLAHGTLQLKLSQREALTSLVLEPVRADARLEAVRLQAAALAIAMLQQKGTWQRPDAADAAYFQALREDPDVFLTAIGMAEQVPAFFLTFYGIYLL